MILSFRTDKPRQTVQTQIRLLLEEQSDQGLHCLHSGYIFWVYYSSIKPSCSNFMVITATILGVRIFRSFTVVAYITVWSSWFYGQCSVTCGNGTTDRVRRCSSGHDEDCPGSALEHVGCNSGPCPGRCILTRISPLWWTLSTLLI